MSSYYVKEVEFRAVREHDKFEVGCSTCGRKDITYDRRWPKDSMVEYIVNKVCICEQEN